MEHVDFGEDSVKKSFSRVENFRFREQLRAIWLLPLEQIPFAWKNIEGLFQWYVDISLSHLYSRSVELQLLARMLS
jgi:hypothetical protein